MVDLNHVVRWDLGHEATDEASSVANAVVAQRVRTNAVPTTAFVDGAISAHQETGIK